MAEDGKKLEVVGGPSNNGPQLIRSPLVSGALAPPPAATSRPPPSASSRQPGGRDGSGLNFIREQGSFNERDHATQLSAVMFDGGAQKRRNFTWVVLLLMLAAGGGALVKYPKLRKTVIYRVIHAKDDLISLVRYKKKGSRAHGQDIEDDEAQGDDKADQRGNRPKNMPRRAARGGGGERRGSGAASEGCAALESLASDAAKMSVPQRGHLAECHLLIDDPSGAEEALRPLRPSIIRTGERELNAMKANDTLADAFLILTQAYVKQGKPREAEELLKGRCTRWEQTNTCVAKLMVAVERKAVNGADGVMKLFGSRGKLDGKAQARLWLAGAQLALDAGKAQTADQRYVLALDSAPRDALSLRKQIFEVETIDLYHRGEALRLKNVVSQAMSELSALDSGAKLKLKVLSELSSSGNKPKTVRSLLTREDVTWRARGDFDLIEILGPESIKSRNEEPYIALLHHTAERFSAKYKASNTVLKKLATWELRALLSQEKLDKVREQLATYEKTYGKDSWSRHMAGIAYMMQDGSQKYQVLAAQEFQEAIRLKSSPATQWETLVALGMALTRAGKGDQASLLIKDLDRSVNTKGQKYWVDMLKAEWYGSREQYVNALALLNLWVKNEPGFTTPHRLRLQVYAKMGKKAEAEHEQGEIDELSRATRYAGSREGISSPVGVMALGNRPLD